MTVLSDKWIKKMAKSNKMISPFIEPAAKYFPSGDIAIVFVVDSNSANKTDSL